MKEIKLTQGKAALVDDDDFERLNQYKWYASYQGRDWYAKRSIVINRKTIFIMLHREIMGNLKGICVDHINGNTLDNRKNNLRLCTHRQNMLNKKTAQKNNKLRIKGVYWNKDAKKFHARITHNGKSIHLGYFNVLGDADSAYRIAEEKYFGEFARGVV